MKIEIGQELEGSKMIFSIAIGGVRVFSIANSKPREFTKVKVFASSGWYTPQNDSIKNLVIENKDDTGITLNLVGGGEECANTVYELLSS